MYLYIYICTMYMYMWFFMYDSYDLYMFGNRSNSGLWPQDFPAKCSFFEVCMSLPPKVAAGCCIIAKCQGSPVKLVILEDKWLNVGNEWKCQVCIHARFEWCVWTGVWNLMLFGPTGTDGVHPPERRGGTYGSSPQRLPVYQLATSCARQMTL